MFKLERDSVLLNRIVTMNNDKDVYSKWKCDVLTMKTVTVFGRTKLDGLKNNILLFYCHLKLVPSNVMLQCIINGNMTMFSK